MDNEHDKSQMKFLDMAVKYLAIVVHAPTFNRKLGSSNCKIAYKYKTTGCMTDACLPFYVPDESTKCCLPTLLEMSRVADLI